MKLRGGGACAEPSAMAAAWVALLLASLSASSAALAMSVCLFRCSRARSRKKPVTSSAKACEAAVSACVAVLSWKGETGARFDAFSQVLTPTHSECHERPDAERGEQLPLNDIMDSWYHQKGSEGSALARSLWCKDMTWSAQVSVCQDIFTSISPLQGRTRTRARILETT